MHKQSHVGTIKDCSDKSSVIHLSFKINWAEQQVVRPLQLEVSHYNTIPHLNIRWGMSLQKQISGYVFTPNSRLSLFLEVKPITSLQTSCLHCWLVLISAGVCSYRISNRCARKHLGHTITHSSAVKSPFTVGLLTLTPCVHLQLYRGSNNSAHNHASTLVLCADLAV